MNEKLQFVRISNNKYSILLYSDSTFKINFKKHEGLTEKFVRKVTSNFVYTILRSLGCTGCSLCEGACEYKAISVQNNTIFVRDDSCTQCNQCFDVCPIVTVVNRDLPYEINREIKIEKNSAF